MDSGAVAWAVVATVLVAAVMIALRTGRAGFLIKSLNVDRATSPKTFWLIIGSWITLAAWTWFDALGKS